MFTDMIILVMLTFNYFNKVFYFILTYYINHTNTVYGIIADIFFIICLMPITGGKFHPSQLMTSLLLLFLSF